MYKENPQKLHFVYHPKTIACRLSLCPGVHLDICVLDTANVAPWSEGFNIFLFHLHDNYHWWHITAHYTASSGLSPTTQMASRPEICAVTTPPSLGTNTFRLL